MYIYIHTYIYSNIRKVAWAILKEVIILADLPGVARGKTNKPTNKQTNRETIMFFMQATTQSPI